jgi:hypothetical protein
MSLLFVFLILAALYESWSLRSSDICGSEILVRPGTDTIERFLDVLD